MPDTRDQVARILWTLLWIGELGQLGLTNWRIRQPQSLRTERTPAGPCRYVPGAFTKSLTECKTMRKSVSGIKNNE
jgi:hypothetical protein